MTQEAKAGSRKAAGIPEQSLDPPSRALGNWPDTDLGPTRKGADVGQVNAKEDVGMIDARTNGQVRRSDRSTAPVNGPEDAMLDWRSIDWPRMNPRFAPLYLDIVQYHDRQSTC